MTCIAAFSLIKRVFRGAHIILLLYPKTINDFVYSVSMFSHSDLTSVNRAVYWTAFILLILFGAVKVILNQIKIEKGQNIFYMFDCEPFSPSRKNRYYGFC